MYSLLVGFLIHSALQAAAAPALRRPNLLSDSSRPQSRAATRTLERSPAIRSLLHGFRSLMPASCSRLPAARSLVHQTSATNLTVPTPEVLADGEDQRLPYARLDDIVVYPGSWPGEEEIGRIALIQYIDFNKKWIADLDPLEEAGRGSGYWREKLGNRPITFDLDVLKPAEAQYERSKGAWFVPATEEGVFRTRADGYCVDRFFEPVQREVDPIKTAKGLQAYGDKKVQLLRDATFFGLALSLLAGGISKPENGLVCAVGVMFNLCYLYLLSFKVDAVGEGNSGALQGSLPNLRFALPPLLLAVLVAYNNAAGKYFADAPSLLFGSVQREQLVFAFAGFLSYRFPLLYRELQAFQTSEELVKPDGQSQNDPEEEEQEALVATTNVSSISATLLSFPAVSILAAMALLLGCSCSSKSQAGIDNCAFETLPCE